MRIVRVGFVAVIGFGLFVAVATATEPLSAGRPVTELDTGNENDRSILASLISSIHAAVTPESRDCKIPDGAAAWHPATDHEHGDAPPAWADAWSCAQFGHPVIYGGDEQTPNENGQKHNAFKGFSWTATADDGRPIEVFLRVHMQTNPHGRSSRHHSYEMYTARDGIVLGFWQGWLDFGASPDHRDSFADQYLWDIVPQYSPANHIVGYDSTNNPYYYSGYSGREFWYSQQATPGGWDPVVILDIYDPSTFYRVGEETNSTEINSWQPTGQFGLDRRVTLRFIVEGSLIPTVSGRPYLYRNYFPPRGWFCAMPTGEISPDCRPGSLSQFISPTMPTIGDSTSKPAKYRAQWACPACQLPN